MQGEATCHYKAFLIAALHVLFARAAKIARRHIMSVIEEELTRITRHVDAAIEALRPQAISDWN